MKIALSGLALIALVSCGAAGEPITPTTNVGLNVGPNGVTPSASVGAVIGGVNLGLSL